MVASGLTTIIDGLIELYRRFPSILSSSPAPFGRDARRSHRLSPLLALEIALMGRAATNRDSIARADFGG